MTNKKFFSGNSVKQAVLQAARHFQLAPEEVAYKEIERRHGFLKVRRRAVIAVSLDQPRRDPNEIPAPQEPAPDEITQPEELPTESPAEAEETLAPQPEDREVDLSEMETAALPVQREPLPHLGEETEPREPDLFAPVDARPAPDPAFSGDRIEAAEESVRQMLELGRLDLEAEVREREHEGELRLEVELSGADEDLLLDDRGRILMSIQHLLPRLVRGLTGESAPCLVDCDNFHEIRAEQLRHLAQRVAAEVRENERSQMLEPMAPDERRIVHLTLADDPAVETASQGNGLFKRVQVRPTRGASGGLRR